MIQTSDHVIKVAVMMMIMRDTIDVSISSKYHTNLQPLISTTTYERYLKHHVTRWLPDLEAGFAL